MTTLKAGDKAPDFKGTIENGDTVQLSDFTGKKLVLYFYPKDNTPGCNNEACNLRDNYDAMIAQGIRLMEVT